MLEEGELAPDFTLSTIHGEPVSLQEILDDEQHVLLIFLRHLG